MISENAVRITVSHISSTTVTSRLHMISSEIGSASIRAIASASGVPGATSACGGAATPIASRRLRLRSTCSAVAGRHDGGRLALLDDRRAFDAVAGHERVAVVDRGLDEAVAEPDLARAFALLRRGGAPAWSSDSSGVGPSTRTRKLIASIAASP